MRSLFLGSDQQQFKQLDKHPHPFEPCPDSPNCIIHTKIFKIPAAQLFNLCLKALILMSPVKINENPEKLRIDALFRIPVFGFKDDVFVAIEAIQNYTSVLHIKSASRTGYGDLGVNSRRVLKFIDNINKQQY